MPPCAIEFIGRFSAEVRTLPKERRREVELVLRRLSEAFGKSHLHSGLGIRRLKRNYFECRAGLDLRVVFKLDRSVLIMARIGNHDDMRNFIKGI